MPRALAGQTGVTTLNGRSLGYRMRDGVKEFHLIAEPVRQEVAPGMVAQFWGYNGGSPGPTIEAVEGDRVRIFVTNRLPEHTTIHWHGLLLPAGMDGVGGLTQPQIKPGETYVYEFTLTRAGTFMYHPHADEMVQMAQGMMGMFIVHPRQKGLRAVDRDYLLMLASYKIDPGTLRPDASEMLDFNLWTFNSRTFPAIQNMVARTGERVRIRVANLTMTNHPIHLHGVHFKVTGTDGGWIPAAAQWPEVTADVAVGQIRVIEFIADAPGDWAFHCHKSHHTMGPMGHGLPNLLGVDQRAATQRIERLFPGQHYMAMGSEGMAEMQDMAAMGDMMPLPANTLPMMTGEGPFGPIEMGGMFTLLKVRDDLAPGDYRDPGWYRHPPGTVAHPATGNDFETLPR
ncbi:exported copper oxidase [Chitiniphilus shinanonensis]|uniref:Exported copper oxidase n=1 Tax=Chitiniphilus shinanonensis TaxID=553088 RepID=A0ABQ6BU27_9NEIS|nr:exported copper oxidase [Chitiniphilus shinanonensis]